MYACVLARPTMCFGEGRCIYFYYRNIHRDPAPPLKARDSPLLEYTRTGLGLRFLGSRGSICRVRQRGRTASGRVACSACLPLTLMVEESARGGRRLCSDPWGSVEPWAGGHRYTTCLVESDHGRRATLPLRIAYLSTDHGPIAPCQDATIQWHRGARRRRGGAAARFGAPRLAARPTRRRHSRLPTASGPRRMADEGAGWDQRGRPLIHGAAPWGAARSRAMGQRRTAAQPGAARGVWG